MVIEVMEEPLKQYSPKYSTEDGIFMDVREEQSLKQENSNIFTEDGMVIEFREEHL